VSAPDLRLPDYLDHLLDAIERISAYTRDMTEAQFAENRLVQDGVIRNLEVIGEASQNIRTKHPEFVASNPELPLAAAYQMRNALAHGYFQVDLSTVWRTVQNDLPGLELSVSAARAALQQQRQ
jgi:uncharacterized protein with HEPN domain